MKRRALATPFIETVAGRARYIGTETEDARGRWNDSYSTRDGYYVVHHGELHDVYLVDDLTRLRREA